MAWIAPVAGAAIGAIGSIVAANKQNGSNRNAGKVDVTTTNSSDPRSLGARDLGGATAQSLLGNALAGGGYYPGGAPAPSGGGGNSTGGKQTVPAGYHINKAGNVVPVKNPANSAPGPAGGGGGNGTPSTAAVKGQSASSSAAITSALQAAQRMDGSNVSTAAQNYTANTLNGQSSNPYQQQAADLTSNLDNAALDRYTQMLFDSDNGLGGGGPTTPAGGGYGGGYGGNFVSNGHGGTVSASGGGGTYGDPTGAVAAIHSILAGGSSPGSAAMSKSITDRATEAYNDALRQRRLEASGSNMYGGSGQMADEAYGTAKFGSQLGDALAQQDYALYQQALGQGTGYDENINDNDTSRQNAALAASTSAGNASLAYSSQAAALAQQGQLARMGALGNAVGMNVQNQQAQASGMGALADNFSGDQRTALGQAGAVNGMDQAGYMNAGNLSLGGDQNQNAYTASQNQLRAAQIAGGNQRAALDFSVYQYNHAQPMNDLAQYTNIINGTYGGPGSYSQNTQGWDLRNTSPGYVSPITQGIAGAVGGYQLGSQIYNSYQNSNNGGG